MAARFWVGGTGTWDNASTTHWASTSGGAGGASVPGSGDTVTFDGNSGGGTVTPNYDLSVVSITMGAFTGTLDFSANNNSPTIQTFNCSGTGVRTLNMGSGTWNVIGNATTIWTVSVITNLTFNANTSNVVFSYSGSTGTRNIVPGSLSTIIYNNISFSAGSDIITMSNISCNGNFSTSGFTGNFNKSTGTINVAGNFTLGAGSTWTSTSGTITLNASSSATINTNGVVVNQNITINGTGTFTLAGNIDMSGAVGANLIITQGTFTTNNFNIAVPVFSSSNSNVRTINLGSSILTITGNAATVFNVATTTNLTLNAGTSVVLFNYSGSVGTRILALSSAVAFNDVTINAATDAVQFSLNTNFATGVFTCSMPIASNVAGAVRTITAKSFILSGVTSISDLSLTINNNAGTFSMTEDLNFTGTVGGILTLNGGTFATTNFNVNCKQIISSTGTRNISFGSSTLTLSGTGTLFNFSSTSGLTFSAGTSTIKLTDGTSASKTFSVATGMTFYNIWLTGNGTGVFNINSTGNATFNTFRVQAPLTVAIKAGTTIICTSIIWSGLDASDLNVFQSGTPGTQWILQMTSNVNIDFVSIKDSYATGGAWFYATPNSINGGNNSGWIFLPVGNAGNFFKFMR